VTQSSPNYITFRELLRSASAPHTLTHTSERETRERVCHEETPTAALRTYHCVLHKVDIKDVVFKGSILFGTALRSSRCTPAAVSHSVRPA